MRRRILLLVAGMTTLVVLAFAIPLAVLIRSAVVQRATDSLGEQALTVASELHTDPTDAELTAFLARFPQTRDNCTSVQTPTGTFGTAPPISGPQRPEGDTDVDPGFAPAGGGPGGPPRVEAHPVPGGQLVVIDVRNTAGNNVIQSYRSTASLRSGEAGWWWLLGGGSVFLLLVGIGGGELVTRRIVRPLVRTADTAHRMTEGDVTAQAPTDGPREVAEVGSALNRLGARIDELLAEERETIADLSHRLRTPLTALRLDAEGLRDPAEAERIGTHITALERALTAVIRAARRPQREGRLPGSDARAVLLDRVEFWSALTEDQGRARTLIVPDDPVPVRASGEDLAAAIDALLENVVAHTADGTAFSVELAREPDGVALAVSDAGPGLPLGADERGRSDRGSTGLGLDIARQVAVASGGSLDLGRSAAGGARVTLHLGAR
jgi:signal transduction histidine kinase